MLSVGGVGIMNCYLVLVLSLYGLVLSLPPYIKPCDINSPEFDTCALDHANYAISNLVKGDKKLGIPPLDPFKFAEIEINENGLKLQLKDIKVYGLANAKATSLKLNSKVFEANFQVDNLVIVGRYAIEGKILILKLEGQGDANITAVGGDYHIVAPLKMYSKGEERYVKIVKPATDYKFRQVHFDFTNLFDGDPTLGPQINAFVNENWRDVVQDLGAPIRETINHIVQSTVAKILIHIPISQHLFPQRK